ncbi:MAG TPA: glycosyltransferase family 39 protein [Candidatus Eisenbacteria bacterium]|nr:glycosyltransferase family 39 protein [Candidatus Eisenbacteria bacterium]
MKRKLLFAALAGLTLFLFFFRLGERSFRNPDEGRYAEIAREMVVSGDWIEPHLYGLDYLRKPALFYWLVAGSFKLFGRGEFAARAVPALFGLFGVVATWLFARRYFGARAAAFAALILATNVWYVEVGRYLLIDAVFGFFLTAAFFSFYAAWREGGRRFWLAFYAFVGLAFLAKGVAAVAIPALAVLGYFIWTRRLKEGISRSFSPAGILLFLAIVLPWFVAISVRESEFLNFFFLHEHVTRYLSKDFEHQEPWFFYLALLPAVFFPWVFFWAPVKKGFAEKGPAGFLAAVFCAVVGFYSLSRSKLATYLVPAIPPAAVLLGSGWAAWTEREGDARPGRGTVLALGSGLAALAGAVFVVYAPWGPHLSRKVPAPEWILLILLSAAAEFAVLLFLVRRGTRKAVFFSIIGFLSAASVLVAFAMESENEKYTTKHFAEILRPKLDRGQEVYLHGQPGAFYDFAFYLDRPVKLIGLDGELVFNEGEEETKTAVVTPKEWESLLADRQIFTLMRRSDYTALDPAVRNLTTVLAEDERKVLVSSR